MDTTAALAVADPVPPSPFGAMLAEALTDMELAAAEALMPEDALQRLSLDTQRALLALHGGQLPRLGGQLYLKDSVALPAPSRSLLDVRF